MPRRALTLAALLLGLAAGVAAAAVAAGPGSVYGRPAVNRAAAHRAASALLEALRPPAGATPGGDIGGRLAHPGFDEATPNLVDAHRWFVTTVSPAAAIAQVARHLPPGVLAHDGGSEGGPGLQERSWGLSAGAGLTQRLVSVSVVAVPGGETLVRLDGEAVWLSPRAVATRIAVGAVDSATFSGHGQRPDSGPLANSTPLALGAAAARALAAALNADELTQPGVIACPAGFADEITVTLRGGAGRSIARAVESPTGCPSVALALAGGPRVRLVDGASAGTSLSAVLVRRGAIPSCTIAELAAGTTTAHQRTLYVTLRDGSRSICLLRGVPGLALTSRTGRTLAARDHPATSQPDASPVILYPGTLAEFTATYRSCAAATPARTALVGLPGAPTTLRVPIAAHVTPCPGGPLDVSAMLATP